ncbi:hypothetical protein [Arenibaculum pallidiluteum]|uniref:hypothetical protein n=1 Tax=Arenibaculum pallidiluteum TaxID=2812559 RepID=UPI001A9607AD|nr:hypothetical protein [Arenibaculum pallidiluteum]
MTPDGSTSLTPGRGAVLAGLAALGVACLAGYMTGRAETDPPTLLAATPCGISGGDTLSLPPELLSGPAQVPLLLGPISVPGAGPPVLVRFDPALAAEGEARLRDGVLTLPPRLAGGRLPDAITLACRDGAISSVIYRHGATATRLPVSRG